MVREIYSDPILQPNVTNVTKKVENGFPHVCLSVVCLCLLKSNGITTLFSQLWKLNNFAKKKSSKFIEKFSVFEKKSEIEKISNPKNIFENFSLKIILKIEIFEILIFDFQYDFQ